MKKIKKILSDLLLITLSVTDDRPQSATTEEFHNHVNILFHDLEGWCKKCIYDKDKDCYYKCEGFEFKSKRKEKKFN